MDRLNLGGEPVGGVPAAASGEGRAGPASRLFSRSVPFMAIPEPAMDVQAPRADPDEVLQPLDDIARALGEDARPLHLAQLIHDYVQRCSNSAFMRAAQMVADDREVDVEDDMRIVFKCLCQSIVQLHGGPTCRSFLASLHAASSTYALFVIAEAVLMHMCDSNHSERLSRGQYSHAFFDLLHSPMEEPELQQLAAGSRLDRGQLRAPFRRWNFYPCAARHENESFNPEDAAVLFSLATRGKLDAILGDNMVAAGGIVLHALKGTPMGDIDLFFVGLSREQAKTKILGAIQLLQPEEVVVTRQVVTLKGIQMGDPDRLVDVQIMQRLYTSKQQVVASFDLAPCR